MLWLLVWDGYGGPPDHPPGLAIEVSPSLTASGRKYRLHRGAISRGVANTIGPPHLEPPNFWWPEDRAWFVSTDIDGVSTYVGGSEELVDLILAEDSLEALPAELEDATEGSPHRQSR